MDLEDELIDLLLQHPGLNKLQLEHRCHLRGLPVTQHDINAVLYRETELFVWTDGEDDLRHWFVAPAYRSAPKPPPGPDMGLISRWLTQAEVGFEAEEARDRPQDAQPMQHWVSDRGVDVSKIRAGMRVRHHALGAGTVVTTYPQKGTSEVFVLADFIDGRRAIMLGHGKLEFDSRTMVEHSNRPESVRDAAGGPPQDRT